MTEGLEGLRIVAEGISFSVSVYVFLVLITATLTVLFLIKGLLHFFVDDGIFKGVISITLSILFFIGFLHSFNLNSKATKYYYKIKVVPEEHHYFIDAFKWKIINREGDIITLESVQDYDHKELEKIINE